MTPCKSSKPASKSIHFSVVRGVLKQMTSVALVGDDVVLDVVIAFRGELIMLDQFAPPKHPGLTGVAPWLLTSTAHLRRESKIFLAKSNSIAPAQGAKLKSAKKSSMSIRGACSYTARKFCYSRLP